MDTRPLGDTGLNPSVIGFGLWTVSTTMWGISDDEFGKDLLNHAFNLGITFYDTADVYGDGKGETLLADALGAHRDEIVIATKFGYDFVNYPGVQAGQRERPHDWSPAFVRAACEASLKRLNTDRIDVYQMHNPRIEAMQSEDLISCLEDLKAEGKIRLYGAALGPALKPERQVDEGLYAVKERKMLVHIIMNMLEQQLSGPICPAASENGVPVLVRVPHASGVLEGAFDETIQFSPNDHRSFRVTTNEMRRAWLDDGIKKLEMLKFCCEDAGRTPAQMALQWVKSHSSIRGIFPNIYDHKQLEEFAATDTTRPFSQEELAKVAELYANDFYLHRETASV